MIKTGRRKLKILFQILRDKKAGIFERKGVRIMSVVLLVLLIFTMILLGLFLSVSPGKPEPFLDEIGRPLPGSISEKVFVRIGGVDQGMFIRSKDVKNPVLLFVHGGPCFPEYFLMEKYPTGLEDSFTVCCWEERGGGISYNSEVTPDSMTLDQLTSDTIELTNYLRERFGQDKVYLMAHSGGTSFAIQAAAEAPELYSAYIGIAQLTRQAESEKLAYAYMMEQYSAAGNTKMIKKLKEYPVLESDSQSILFFKSALRDQSMHELGIGTMRSMDSIAKDILLPVMTCRAYTPGEKMKIWMSKLSFLKKTKLIDEVFSADFTEKVKKLEVPVYFFSGSYDYTVNYELSKAYLKQLEAPVKGFYTFEQSAHSPLYEEPEKLKRILEEDVLAGASSLSDRV